MFLDGLKFAVVGAVSYNYQLMYGQQWLKNLLIPCIGVKLILVITFITSVVSWNQYSYIILLIFHETILQI
jgi:hypothetical protein